MPRKAPRDNRRHVKIAYDFTSNRKLAVLGDPAFIAMAGWTLLQSIIDSATALSDGLVVPSMVLRKTGAGAEIAKALIEEGLWHEQGHDCDRCPPVRAGHVYIHDYLLHQRSAEASRELSTVRSRTGKEGIEKRWARERALLAEQEEVRRNAPPGTVVEEPEPAPVKKRAPKVDEIPRPDVDELCAHLADWIERNGSKRPDPTLKGWRTACRLLIDVDGRTPDQIRNAINWCQQDEFWRVNILSMPKLREKYDQLRLAASGRKREGGRPVRGTAVNTRVNLADHAGEFEQQMMEMGVVNAQ